MRYGFSAFIILATTFLVVRSTPVEVGHAADVRTSLTSGPPVCPAPDGELLEDEECPQDEEFPEALAGVETEQLRRKRMSRRKGCYWNGTAPFCAGRCKPGDVLIKRDKRGDGNYCWFGTKAYCCPPQSDEKPKSPPSASKSSTSTVTTRTTSIVTTRTTSVTTRHVTPTTPAEVATTSAHATSAPSGPAPTVQVPLPAPNIPKPGDRKLSHKPKKPKQSKKPTHPQEEGRRPSGIPAASPAPLTQGHGGAASMSKASLPVEGPAGAGGGTGSTFSQPSGHEHHNSADDKSFSDITHNILSGLKGITKLNFMGHFGEFSEPDDYEADEKSDENRGEGADQEF